MNEIFLDTETTGLSFKNGHKIVEIACIETKDLVPTGRVFHKLINPKRDVSKDAYEIHGFSTEFLKNKEAFEEVADEFLNFVNEKKLIIHNAPFDVGFLNGELGLINKELIKKELVIDSLEISRNKYPGSPSSLDALCKKFNIDLSRRTKHNALLDCELLREVYINLLDIKEPRFNLTNHKNEKKFVKRTFYSKKIAEITEAEIKSHEDFLKKELKKNFY